MTRGGWTTKQSYNRYREIEDDNKGYPNCEYAMMTQSFGL